MYRIIYGPSSPRLHRGKRKQSKVIQGAAAPLRQRRRVAVRLPMERKMTTTFSPAAQPAISGSSGGLVRRIEGWAYALIAYWDRRVAIKTLHELDDRALRDIGIVRSQIEAAVGGA